MTASLALVRSLSSLAASINAEHDAAEHAARSAVDHARRAGALLIDAKAQLPHGSWLPWLAEHCPTISERTAQVYMQLAKANPQRVAGLSVREALAVLSEPKEMPTGAPGQPRWLDVALSDVTAVGPGWHKDDDATFGKLVASLREFGQLRALVVRILQDGTYALVEGHKLLKAMRVLGWTSAMAVDIGPTSIDDTFRVRMALEVDFETDYAAVASQVGAAVRNGATPDQLAALAPFDAERLAEFATMMNSSWQDQLAERIAAREAAGDTDDAACPHPRRNPETEYRCPACAYEWQGQNPKPFAAGGRAMQDARDVRAGVRRTVFLCPADRQRPLWQKLRQLQQAFGTADHDATILEAVWRMADLVGKEEPKE